MNFKTPYNTEPYIGQINTQPSQTIPDQSMSISEIMTRYAQGLGYEGPKVPSYDGGNDPFGGINIASLDISEKHDLIERVKDHAIELQQNIKKQQDDDLLARQKQIIKDEKILNKQALKDSKSLDNIENEPEG